MHIINMYSNLKYKEICATVFEIFNQIKTGRSGMSNGKCHFLKELHVKFCAFVRENADKRPTM